MKGSTLFLKLAVFLIGLIVLALTVLLWSGLGGMAIGAVINGRTLGYIVAGLLIGITLSIIPFYAALIQIYLLLTYIDQDKIFSQLAVTALRKIKQYAYITSFIYTGLLPLIYIVAEWDDAPGLIFVGTIPVMGAFVAAASSTVLEYLVEEAINLITVSKH